MINTTRHTLAALLVIVAITLPTLGADDFISTASGQLIVRPINHATIAIAHNRNLALVDPVGPVSRFSGLPTPRAILITDIHGDHCSPDTVLALADDQTVIIAPRAVAEKFPADQQDRVTVLDNDQSHEFKNGSILAVPMYNLTEERKNFHTKGRGNGYVITVDDARIYISGDTEDIPEMRALKDIDIAFICMNLPYTMTLERAADATLEFAPKIVYPYHFRNKDKTYSDTEAFK